MRRSVAPTWAAVVAMDEPGRPLYARLEIPAVSALERRLQRGDVELLHRQKGARHTGEAFRVIRGQHLAHDGRRDLPRDAELVFQPAALLGLRIGREPAPQIVDF